MSDLTERLAAKLETALCAAYPEMHPDDAYMAATEITDWKQAIPLLLPLLLSEPELVAGLADATKADLLEQMVGHAVARKGYRFALVDGHLAVVTPTPGGEALSDDVRLSVLTPRERAVMKLGEAHLWRVAVLSDLDARKNEKLNYTSRVNLDDALAEARALSTEAPE